MEKNVAASDFVQFVKPFISSCNTAWFMILRDITANYGVLELCWILD